MKDAAHCPLCGQPRPPVAPRIGLTRRQRAALDFIEGEIVKNDVPPSLAEIAAHLGLANRGGAHRVLKALSERGHIGLSRYRARSIYLIEPPVTSLSATDTRSSRVSLRVHPRI